MTAFLSGIRNTLAALWTARSAHHVSIDMERSWSRVDEYFLTDGTSSVMIPSSTEGLTALYTQKLMRFRKRGSVPALRSISPESIMQESRAYHDLA